MPSISLIGLTLNFPPDNCVFTINQSTSIGYSLETRYVLAMENCTDNDSPI